MDKTIWDLIIIGAGPSALTAAIYASREDISTLLIEKAVIGGLMATIDKIENYPGFPNGVEGLNLSLDFQSQAEKFGAKIELAEVQNIAKTNSRETHSSSAKSSQKSPSPKSSALPEEISNQIRENNLSEIFTVTTDNGNFFAKTVLIATGCNYRHLGITGENDFAHYCATCDGAFYRGKRLVVIGGANSAVQEAMFLTKFATHVDMLVRSWIKASDVLKKELAKFIADGKISLFEGTTPDEILAKNGQVVGVRAHKTASPDDQQTFVTDGVFVFAGVIPNSEFAKNSGIACDPAGHILIDENFMTNLDGIFAAGDVRAGSPKQVVAAAGDGASAALAIREHLGKIKR